MKAIKNQYTDKYKECKDKGVMKHGKVRKFLRGVKKGVVCWPEKRRMKKAIKGYEKFKETADARKDEIEQEKKGVYKKKEKKKDWVDELREIFGLYILTELLMGD